MTNKLTQLSFRVDARLKKALQKWSEFEGVSQTHLITEYLKGIERKVKKVEEANPSP